MISLLWYISLCKKIENVNFNMSNITFILIMLIEVIAIIYIVIHIIKNYKNQMEKIFLSLCIPLGIAYAIFLIPGSVPDEESHYFRAYEISRGNFISEKNEYNISKYEIPISLAYIRKQNVYNYDKMINLLQSKVNEDFKIQEDDLTQSYFPILYVIPALAFFIGKILGLSMMLTLYLAKIFNLVLFMVCGYFTIKLLPFGKIMATIYLLTPMILQQACSVSADAFVNCICIIYVAYIMYLVFKEDIITKKERIIYYILAVLLAVSKTVYFPLIFISLLLLFRKKNKDKEHGNKAMVFIGIILCTIIAMSWVLFISQFRDGREELYSVSEGTKCYTVEGVIEDPGTFLKKVVKSVEVYGSEYLETFFGSKLGWLNIEISEIVILVYAFLLFVSPFLEKNKYELSTKQKGILMAVFIIIFLIIMLALYTGWTRVYIKYTIEGIQGRYFIPTLILILLCACYKNKYVEFKNLYVIYLIIAFVNNYAIFEIIKHFV